jgi:hypothetical protein
LAGALLTLLLLWLFGAVGGGRDVTVELSSRLASIERRIDELSSRPGAAAVDPKATEALDALDARLGRLETTPRAPAVDPAASARLTAVEQAQKSLADAVAALGRRGDSIETGARELKARLDGIDGAIAELKTTTDGLRESLREASAGSDRASRLAIAAGALRGAIDRGDPFAAELAVMKPLMPDADALAALEPFAASGVPGDATLARELAQIVRPMLTAASEPRQDGTLLERLQANAERLVRVRRLGEPVGDDRNAVLARIEQRAAKGDLAGAQAEIAKLPADAKSPLEPWLARTAARDRAIAASRKLLNDAVAALKAQP